MRYLDGESSRVCCHLLEFVLIVLNKKVRFVHGHLCFGTGSGFDPDSMGEEWIRIQKRHNKKIKKL
jgi:hypothetical protein